MSNPEDSDRSPRDSVDDFDHLDRQACVESWRRDPSFEQPEGGLAITGLSQVA